MLNTIKNSFFSKSPVWLEQYLDKLGLSHFFQHSIKRIKMRYKNPRKAQVEYLVGLDQWVRDGVSLLAAVKEMKAAAIQHSAAGSFQVRASNHLEIALENGFPLSEGMRTVFDDDFITLFKVGEASGNISELLSSYLQQEELRRSVMKQGVAKTYYPAALVLTIVGMLITINDYGLIEAQKAGFDLTKLKGVPATTLSVASAVSSMWGFFTCMAAVAWAGYAMSKNYYVGKWGGLPSRATLDKYIPFSIHKEFVAMTIIQRIGLLSKQGLPMGQIAQLLEKSATPYEAGFYQKIQARTTATNGTVANYLDIGLLNPVIFSRLSGIAKQQSEKAKVNAILAASRESGNAAQKHVQSTLRNITILLWGAVVTLGGVTGAGLLLFSFQVKQIIQL